MPARPTARTPPAHAVRRVLLIHPGALGDLIQALPAFGAVRAGFPEAHVVLLTDAALATLARGTGLVDEVVEFDAQVAHRGGPGARLRLLASLAARARRVRPDVAGVFKGAPVYAALAAVSGARWRAGLTRGVGRLSTGSRLLTCPLPIDPRRHREDRFLDVAGALGVDLRRRTAPKWAAHSSPVPHAVRARAWPLVGIAPGGARNVKEDAPTRRWAAARFANLARDLLVAHPDAVFVLLGGPGDRGEVDVVRAALPAERVIDLAGRTDLAAARLAIADLDVYVGNDSGLMHLAGTTSTPTVIAFGPSDPRVAAPRTPGMRAEWDPVPDPPCYSEIDGARRPCQTPCCIERLDVARMVAAVHAVLGASAARPTTAPG